MDHHSHPTDHTHIHTRPHGTDEIIVCRDVHKWYGEFEALKGVSMTVKRGEVVALPEGSVVAVTALGDEVPKTFATFQRHKLAGDEKYQGWVSAYRDRQT